LVEKGMDARGKATGTSDTEAADQQPLQGKVGFLPDFRGLGMRTVIREARALGLTVLLEGTGFAFKQRPSPGSPLKSVRAVKVSFRPRT
jgi:hypothetical protein